MSKSLCFLGLALLLFAIAVASVAPIISAQPGKLYIIFGLVQRPEDSTALCLRTLAKVFGSEKAANEAVVYAYASLGGVAARLAPDQASRLSRMSLSGLTNFCNSFLHRVFCPIPFFS